MSRAVTFELLFSLIGPGLLHLNHDIFFVFHLILPQLLLQSIANVFFLKLDQLIYTRTVILWNKKMKKRSILFIVWNILWRTSTSQIISIKPTAASLDYIWKLPHRLQILILWLTSHSLNTSYPLTNLNEMFTKFICSNFCCCLWFLSHRHYQSVYKPSPRGCLTS